MNKRIETKVYGAIVGTALGGALASFLIWLLGVVVWHASFASGHADDALKAVPYPVSGLLLAVLGLAGTAAGGYSAPRTTDAERGVEPTLMLDDASLVEALDDVPAGDARNHLDAQEG